MERPIDRIEQTLNRGGSGQALAKRQVMDAGDYARHSPFLRLSEDWFAAPGGFETHPHRGMETVTLVLEGALRHRDHTGADGVLRAGDVQWMTAGRGVLHSEMPQGTDTVHSLQLWLNLPARDKMTAARYVDQPLSAVQVRRLPGVEARVYAGASGDVTAPHGSQWPMMLIDIAMQADSRFVQEIPASYRGFLYAIDGTAEIGSQSVTAPDVAWFEPGQGDGMDSIVLAAPAPFRGLLYAAAPIDEPMVAYGPFVMNTREEIAQAFADYQANRLTG